MLVAANPAGDLRHDNVSGSKNECLLFFLAQSSHKNYNYYLGLGEFPVSVTHLVQLEDAPGNQYKTDACRYAALERTFFPLSAVSATKFACRVPCHGPAVLLFLQSPDIIGVFWAASVLFLYGASEDACLY